ncbi:unnamed protein product [Macrosiphum euphorbiae]|uniref:F-box domain-containing protein n=1 Tax=Macrosiphum euphorbiae TaxID=13131 RepID=A0AAV0XHW3_9HEMI|nr:unnamed protein product [Macrosiphum euphorbiae]
METLPSEIITQILEYLPFDDRRELARVNKVFYHASSHPVFLRKELLHYHPYLDNFNNFKNMLLKSRRKFLCLKISGYITFIDYLTIFTNLGNRIISLNLIHMDLFNDSFLDALTQCCSNLEQLELKDGMDLILTDKDRKPMLKLCSITLNRIQISDRGFNLILKLAPNLKDLGILNCSIVDLDGTCPILGGSWTPLRFYPDNINIDCSFYKYNSNEIFSEYNIVHHLSNYVRLNSLRLNHGTRIFYQIKPIQFQFKSLSLNYKCQSLYAEFIDYEKLSLVLGQCVFLEQLKIYNLPVGILSIVSKLYNLRHLKLSYNADDSNYSDASKYLKSLVESLKNLKYISTLSFSRDRDFNEELILPIYPFPECTLKSLTSLDCSLDSNLEVLKFGKNLTKLRIRNGDILKVEDLQILFRNLTYLKHLRIENCSVLNDEIFIDLPISILKELITLKIISSNISHRCLRHITNSRLKVLTLTNVSLEPCSTQAEFNEFEHSVEILSRAIPKLTELCIRLDNISSLTICNSSDSSTYFWKSLRPLLKSYFERLKIFKLETCYIKLM